MNISLIFPLYHLYFIAIASHRLSVKLKLQLRILDRKPNLHIITIEQSVERAHKDVSQNPKRPLPHHEALL